MHGEQREPKFYILNAVLCIFRPLSVGNRLKLNPISENLGDGGSQTPVFLLDPRIYILQWRSSAEKSGGHNLQKVKSKKKRVLALV